MMITHGQPEKKTADDWYAHGLRLYAKAKKHLSASPLSAGWVRAKGKDRKVRDLLGIRDIVRNMVRVQGVPKSCHVELAGHRLEGAAAAGFEDAPAGFQRPFIMLDKRAYEQCSEKDVLNVYLGLGLHESGHILFTRDGFRRRAQGMSRNRCWFDNLWEDERIEELVRQDSPGFAPYFQATKRALLENQELGQSISRWDDLPDLDKVNALIFAFIRCPYLITPAMQSWTTINGECIFATLRGLFAGPPASEADVDQHAVVLEDLVERLRRLYAGDGLLAAGGVSGRSGQAGSGAGSGGSAAAERKQRQARADAEDRAIDASKSGGRTDVREAVRNLLKEAEKLENIGDSAGAQALLEEALQWEAVGDVAAARSGRRFAWPEIEKMQERANTITRPLDAKEEETLRRVESERLLPGDAWDWDKSSRRTIITYPQADDRCRAAYCEALADVRGHVAAMRAALSVRLAERVYQQTERREGRLHRRRLALASVTDRVFHRRFTRSVPGFSLALLLDASGSMRRGTPSKCSAALRVAVLAAEALRNIPGIELEIYDHTSGGHNHRDCIVQYLYGKQHHDPVRLGCYGGWGENYDHQAILTTADLFVANTKNPRRMLIVVSDGAPNGKGYSGEPAVRATCEAVGAVRRRGIQVINVAIENYASEAIFGSAHVLKFTDMGRLVADMRILLTRLLRS